MERGRSVVRLSEYVYLLLHPSAAEPLGAGGDESPENTAPASVPPPPPPASTRLLRPPSGPRRPPGGAGAATAWSTAYAKPLLCQPVMLEWRKDVMVHFVVPVKNQARWVQQFISDMATLYRQTMDDNFNVVIVDFESDDMDAAGYEYLRKEGNFERSAGLQIGVDTIE
ncbi:hypothetical protein CRUP_036859, partial [Coryphaenoides rupestris]